MGKNSKIAYLTLYIWLCVLVGSVVADIDHIPKYIFNAEVEGRLAHIVILGDAIFCFGIIITLGIGLWIWKVLINSNKQG